MATINNKLIHFKSKSDFDDRYAESTDGGKTYGDFLGTSIVFIQDAKQIWTHGQFYDANEATLASLGITATAAELNYMDGVTSNVQTQLNEIKESVNSISDPYEINLTNLLSAEDSESISTAIGGIDNLNATVQDNRLIVGTISNGNVSVSIRILGNVTTLYYLLDSVVGLTLNEIAITNTSGTSGTLSKSVTTHSVLTENMVINSLNSDETTLPLSAAQGKALNSKIDSIDVSADITNAINALDSSGQTTSAGEVISSVSQENGVISVSKKTLVSDDIPELPQSKITNLETTLAAKQNATDNNLDTEDKTVVGAINEVKSAVDTKLDVYRLNELIILRNEASSAEISTAIGTWDSFYAAVQKHSIFVDNIANIIFYQFIATIYSETEVGLLTYGSSNDKFIQIYITNTDGNLSLNISHPFGDDNKSPVYTTVPELTSDYTIPANATTAEFIYQIPVGATPYNITGAEGIKWASGVAPTTQMNHTYIVSVINNFAVWGEF